MSYLGQSLHFACKRVGKAQTCLLQLAASKAGIVFKRSWIGIGNVCQSWNYKILVCPCAYRGELNFS